MGVAPGTDSVNVFSSRSDVAYAEIRCRSQRSGDEGLSAHRARHRSLYQASRSGVLVRLLDDLWDESDRDRRLGLEQRPGSESRERDWSEHGTLLDLVVAGQGAEVAHLLRQDTRNSLTAAAVEALEVAQAGPPATAPPSGAAESVAPGVPRRAVAGTSCA